MIIGIGGLSRSGKTTLALQLHQQWEDQGFLVKVLHQDDYAQPEDRIPMVRDRVDWECPESMDFARFRMAIQSAAEIFDTVIAEGLLVFYDPAINTLFDRRILVETDRETFLKRRALENRWGPEPVWYHEYVWDSYFKYGRTVLEHNPEVERRFT